VAAGDSQIDPATVWISFLMSLISLLDRYIAAVDVVAKFLQAGRIGQNKVINLL
jgi:hypothetical protein